MRTINKLLKIGLVLVVLFWSFRQVYPVYSQGKLDIWLLDVGQGESVLVREPSGKKLLFDGGQDDSVLAQLGQVMPFMDNQIDLMILSHTHSDHIAGLIPVLERYQVKEIWYTGALGDDVERKEFLKIAKERKVKISYVYAKENPAPERGYLSYPFGQAQFTILHPFKDWLNLNSDNAHDADIVLRMTLLGKSLLLTGDLNEEHEADIISHCHSPDCTLRSDILQLPHHGSNTGLTNEFLAAIKPKLIIIPVGLDNKFGHPGKETMAKIIKAKIPYFRTDLQGRGHWSL